MRKFFIAAEEKINTKTELIFYLEQIDLAMELISKDISKSLAEKIEGKVASGIKDIILDFNKEKEQEDIDQQIFFLELLKKHIFFLPQVRMEIAFHPDKETVERITEWLKKETGEKTVVDFRVNPQVVGGAVFEHKGNWADFSLLKEIEGMSLNNFEENLNE